VAPFRKLSSSGAVAVKSCFAVASIYNIITSLPHDTMQARYMLWPCVHLCMSVTSRRSTKTATHKITQTKPHDSSRDSSFLCQRSPRNSTGVTPHDGAKCRRGGLKLVTFDKWLAISRKRYQTDAWFLLKLNRKLYAIYRMVTV